MGREGEGGKRGGKRVGGEKRGRGGGEGRGRGGGEGRGGERKERGEEWEEFSECTTQLYLTECCHCTPVAMA